MATAQIVPLHPQPVCAIESHQARVVSIHHQKRTAIINRYLALSQELARVKNALEILKAEAVETLGEGTHETKSARVTINQVERTTLDSAKAKTFLTAKQVAQCAKVSSYLDVRVKGL